MIFLLYFILCLSTEALLKSIIYYCSFWILVTACSQRTAIIICIIINFVGKSRIVLGIFLVAEMVNIQQRLVAIVLSA